MLQELLERARAGQGCDRFCIVVDHVGKRPAWTQNPSQVTAYVFAFYDLSAKESVVLLVDGGTGASITNSCGEILPFVFRHHLARRGIRWRNVRWIYRDTMSFWDEIVANSWDGGNVCSTDFRPLGGRQLEDALAAVRIAGLRIDAHDFSHIKNAIGWAGQPAA